MKYRHVSEDTVYHLALSETDINGHAVYYFVVDTGIAYRLFKPEDMIEVNENDSSQEKQGI